MGIFGWIARKTTSAFKAVGTAVANGYKKFTGKATFEEADRMYEDIKSRFEQHKAYFEKEVELLSSDIDDQVKVINRAKITIKTELFPAFAEKMKCLKDIPISDDYMK